MAIEIERKFIVKPQNLPPLRCGRFIRQGYLLVAREKTVRVRIADEKSWLTIKGEGRGLARSEFEYEIPRADAEELWRLCGTSVLEKTRYRLETSGHVWEIDEFHGVLRGLMLAEVELCSESEDFVRHDWLGREVSLDPAYTNAVLAERGLG